MPPGLSIKLPELSELSKISKPWSHAELPIDILLLTVEDCEFLSCFYYLDKPFKSYCKETGYVYFGSMGSDDQQKLKIALMKCSKGSVVPGGSLTVVKNAVRVLRPKAVFSVGACIALNSEKVKLGDVVLSSKLTTSFYKTPVSRDIGNIIRNVADGWQAPLEDPDVLDVSVHCGDVLSQPQVSKFRWRHEDIIQDYPEAIAVDTEGEGKVLLIIFLSTFLSVYVCLRYQCFCLSLTPPGCGSRYLEQKHASLGFCCSNYSLGLC